MEGTLLKRVFCLLGNTRKKPKKQETKTIGSIENYSREKLQEQTQTQTC